MGSLARRQEVFLLSAQGREVREPAARQRPGGRIQRCEVERGHFTRAGEFKDKKLPAAQFGYFFDGMSGLDTPDPYTVVFSFSEPNAPFINYAASDITTRTATSRTCWLAPAPTRWI